MKSFEQNPNENILNASVGGEHLDRDYYERYDSFFDLEMMGERIKSLALPETFFGGLKNKNAEFLVLGSATTKNINGITKIVHHVHGKENVGEDTVSIVDINEESVAIHQKAIDDLDVRSEWSGQIIREVSAEKFPYPQFKVKKGDIRDLPQEDKSIDIVISDYTINYLDSLEGIERCFTEVSRVLQDDGTLFITVRFIKEGAEPERILQGGIPICKFGLQDYIDTAVKSGLELVKRSEGGEDVLMVFKKRGEK